MLEDEIEGMADPSPRDGEGLDRGSEPVAQGELNQARRHGVDGRAEAAAGDIAPDACRAEELGVVEEVEGFGAHFQRLGPLDRNCPGERGVEILESRTGEKAAAGAAYSSQRRQGELGGVEDRFAASRIPIEVERLTAPIRSIDAVVVDAVGDGAEQRGVVVVEQGDRQAGGKARYSCDGPVLGRGAKQPDGLWRGQLILEAGDEVLAEIES